jgi:hypothetical protein
MQPLRRITIAMLGLAFAAAGVAGVLGAFINKAATIR